MVMAFQGGLLVWPVPLIGLLLVCGAVTHCPTRIDRYREETPAPPNQQEQFKTLTELFETTVR
jgi:hypothetical protein